MFRLSLLMLIFLAVPAAATPVDSKVAVEELLAIDREFSGRAATAGDMVSGLEEMFDDQVVMPVAGKGHLIGRYQVLAELRSELDSNQGGISWAPVRGGISADGTHGFTFGYLTLTSQDTRKNNRKYLSYWIKRPEGWRVAAYRQQVREAGEISTKLLSPSLPASPYNSAAGPSLIDEHKRELAAAEKNFSNRAQVVGLRAAFYEYGREDSMNMYNGVGFTVGRDAISRGFPSEVPSKIHWGAEFSLVAPSGDLGVNFGTILPTNAASNGTATKGFPFFTIWRRDGLDKPWRYIAE